MYTSLFLPLFLGNFRGSEWIIIGLIVLLLFGGRKIPELMRGLGKGLKSFKQGMKEAQDELNRPIEDSDRPADKERTTGKDKD